MTLAREPWFYQSQQIVGYSTQRRLVGNPGVWTEPTATGEPSRSSR